MKDSDEGGAQQNRSDVAGIVLIGVAVLLLLATFSYDKLDLGSSEIARKHNWIGAFGAWTAFALFSLLGATGYLVPPLLLIFGLAYFIPNLGPLLRRWPWALVLVLCGACTLSLYHSDRIKNGLGVSNAGGFIGEFFYNYVFSHFNVVGATIIFLVVYLVSLLFLTNFQLGDWAREKWHAWRAGRTAALAQEEFAGTAEGTALEHRARDLDRQARQLQEEIDRADRGRKRPKESSGGEGAAGALAKSNLGADLQPVPEPRVRDLSMPQGAPSAPAVRSRKIAAAKEPAPAEEGMIISARELRPATAADILGRSPAGNLDETRLVEPPQSEAKEKRRARKSAEKPAEPLPEPSAPKEGELVVHIAPTATAVAAPASPMTEPAVPAPENPSMEEPPAEAAVSIPVVPPRPKLAPRRPKPVTVASAPLIGNYQLPSLDFLQLPDLTVKPTETKEELMANARLMQQTLAQFDIEVALGDITKGPTITRYELHPAPGVKFEKITGLSNNIAAALKAERINILAPVPGKSSVGIEVPNSVKTKVIMRDLLESEAWRTTKARIPLALGKDVYGEPIIADLGEMPHLLIAGSTGSGKSVCINSIIASLLYRFPPDQLRFVMIDPKVVELQQYNVLPHLVVPVVTDPKKVILALRWAVQEMEKRYKIFAKVGVRNIKSFNDRPKDKPLPPSEPELPLTAKTEKVEPGTDGFAVEVDEEIAVPREEEIVIPEKLSYTVVIIDELADLMLVAPADVEMLIARLTQMARAAGIHVIVATQRPSVDVITGVIKANIPARIAFQVASRVDSRTILDAMGADKLLGKGDMLYLPPGAAKLNRAQGALITDQEIQSVVDFIAKQGKPSYEMEIHQKLQKSSGNFDAEGAVDEEDEEIVEKAIEVIRQEKKASTSLLQRRMGLGYGRAARLLDVLENRGIVGPSNGAKPRDVLLDLDGTGADGGDQHLV
jgi:S-DNA-T family DNA segregation ATPase FtsK/SpoIIIE